MSLGYTATELLLRQKHMDNLIDAMVADVLAASDEDILAEAKEDGLDPEQIAKEGRDLFDAALREVRLRGEQ